MFLKGLECQLLGFSPLEWYIIFSEIGKWLGNECIILHKFTKKASKAKVLTYLGLTVRSREILNGSYLIQTWFDESSTCYMS